MKNAVIILLSLFFSFSFLTTSAQWTQLPGPQGGYCNALTQVGNEIWAGSANGIFISTDNGLTWHKSPFLNNNNVAGIWSQGDTTIIIYSAPYDTYSDGSAQSIRSIDGRQTWSAPILFPNPGSTPPGNLTVSKVRNTLFATTTSTSYIVTFDYANTWSVLSIPQTYLSNLVTSNTLGFVEGSSGSGYASIYISTDGLHTWQFLDSAQNFDAGFVDDSVILLGLHYYDTITPNRIIRSADLGQTWDTVFNISQTHVLGYFIASGNSIYAYESDSANDQLLYKSNDEGVTWSAPMPFSSLHELGGSIYLGNGNYLQRNENGIIIYDAGQDLSYDANTGIIAQTIYGIYNINGVLYGAGYSGLYVSRDAGLTWTVSLPGMTLIAAMTSIGDTIFAANYGIVACSYDNGQTWPQSDTFSTYYLTGQGPASLARINGRIIYSGSIIQYTDNYGQSWNAMPLLPDMSYDAGPVTALGNKLFSVNGDGNVYSYDAAAQSWDSLTSFWSTGAATNNIIYNLDSILVLSGQNILWRSYDQGASWNPSPLTGLPSAMFTTSIPLSIISVQGLWVGAVDSFIYVSSDSGTSWAPIQSGSLPFVFSESTNVLTLMNNILYAATPYSSVWRRAGTFAALSGTVYQDYNNNGTQDPGEPGMSGVVVSTSPGGILAATDTGGHYTLVTDAIGDSVQLAAPLSYITFNPSAYATTGIAATGVNFGAHIPADIRDLSTDITATRHFAWGTQNNSLQLTVLNKGSQPQAATLMLVLDSGFTYSSASPAPAYMNGDTMVWVSGTLSLLQRYEVTVSVSTYGFIGSLLACHSIVTPVTGDTLPADNYASLLDSIVGPFDPNSKECAQGSYITPQQVAQSQQMTYTIRFQNDGNAPAVNIKVSDTLSPYFDAKTLQIISSSYPATIGMSGQNTVDFYFNNINLPPSSQNSAASCGFVKYEVSCKNDLGLGDAIANTANIFFDSNPAVVSNEALTIVATEALPEGVYATGESSVKIYPNPVSSTLHIDLTRLAGTDNTIVICDQLGRVLISLSAGSEIAAVDVQDFADGIYVGKISQAGTFKASFRFVIAK